MTSSFVDSCSAYAYEWVGTRGGRSSTPKGGWVGPVLITWGQSSQNMGPERMGFHVDVTKETISSKGSFSKVTK
jgi:hypothetical protein